MTQTRSYRVPAMSCAHCEAAIRGELSQVAGVQAVRVSLDTKLVEVDGTELSDERLRAAIAEAGYEAQ